MKITIKESDGLSVEIEDYCSMVNDTHRAIATAVLNIIESRPAPRPFTHTEEK